MRTLGYRIEEARNGRQALRALERGQRIEQLFSEVVMAGEMSGLDLAQKTARRWPGPRVLFTSSYP